MNYGRHDLEKEIEKTTSWANKFRVKLMLYVCEIVIICALLVCSVAASGVVGAAVGIATNAPELNEEDIAPKGLATTIYDTQGNVIQTLISSGANRSLITYDEVPQDLIDAFVAIEDERYWTHEGVDIKGIVRAGFVGVTNGFKFTEGASTITQQLIKNNVLGGGSEKTVGARFVRKIQEQYLAVNLEKNVSKEDIIVNYMNTINLGAGTLGVQKAAEKYFGKDVSSLTLSECAVIAGITQNPYAYNPIRFPKKNAERREKVLKDMESQGYISAEEKAAALADDVYTRIQAVNNSRGTTGNVYTYFVDRLISDVMRDLQAAGYTEAQASALLYSGGLHIYTTQDPSIQAVVDKEIADETNYEDVEQKFSFTYTLRVVHPDSSVNTYTANDVKAFDDRTYLDFDTREEIDELIALFKEQKVGVNDKITYEDLDITLQPQISVVVMDQSTGEVKAIAGGRGEKTASLSLNRATGSCRQPGSTFKVLAVFAPALEFKGDTLATTFYDEPFTVELEKNEYWSPRNWYSSNKYAGYANIRQAITYSMNIIAAKCMVEHVTPELGINVLESFGINTLIHETEENKVSGRNDLRPALALGGITQGVTNLQLTGAFATIANGGTYTEPILYTKILDEKGQTIIDKTPETHTVISEQTAYLLTDAMADSMESSRLNGLFASNSPDAKPSNMPAAGKSGTTNSYNDLWFVGYTPYYTMGIWSGFDDNEKFNKEDNRDFHKIIWRKIMEQITANMPYREFERPDNLVEAKICNKSGKLATEACKADPRSSIISTELFVRGTEPTESCDLHALLPICQISKLIASEACFEPLLTSIITLPLERTGITDDDAYSILSTEPCTECTTSYNPFNPLNPVNPTNPTNPTSEYDPTASTADFR